jgi:nucleotidyltransferase/DNA polymerase involved in DNA repair
LTKFFFQAIPPRGKTHQEYAQMIRDRILHELGVPVTVGIARTRILAKLISDTAKPNGVRAILDPEEVIELLARLPVTEITGIAGHRQKRLLPWNINTCLDLARADRRLVRELLTASGEALWWELNGHTVLPLHPKRPLHKILSRGGSFGEATTDPSVVYAWLVRNLERLVDELVFHEVRTRRVTVWMAYSDGQVGEGRASLESPSDRFDTLLEAMRCCLRWAWIPRAPANRMHLLAERLSPKVGSQLGLFDPDATRSDAVARLKREINRRHGRFGLRSAATLPLVGIYKDPSNDYDICDIRGKMCF